MAVGRAIISPTENDGLDEPQKNIATSQKDAMDSGGSISSGPDMGIQESPETPEDSRRNATARGRVISSGPIQDSGLSFADKLSLARSNVESAARIPNRMYIQSVDKPNQRVDAQFQPERLKQVISTHWNKWDIPGISHQPLQYGFTENDHYEFELLFFAGAGSALNDVKHGTGFPPITKESAMKILDSRDQLMAWHYLRRQDELGGIGDTQRLLFVWPNFISLTCILVSTTFEYEQFNIKGQPTLFRANLVLEEIRDTIMYAEDILFTGNQRSGYAADPNGGPASLQYADDVG